uniref:protein farnesyltransferase subunit beta-like isoform X7 n=1 Tax=Myxine glutinosa TaxID=7769 RepID=UPI00358EB996
MRAELGERKTPPPSAVRPPCIFWTVLDPVPEPRCTLCYQPTCPSLPSIPVCQNWEGGLDGVPGMEAHGGYTFCGLAAMILFGKARMLDLSRLLRWAVNRQMRFEGGFQGRTNKLVDGCYSFWQAGLLPLLHRSLHAEGDSALSSSSWMFHVEALQESACLLPMSSRRDA